MLENVITTLVNNYLTDHWHAVGEILGDSCDGHVAMFIAHVWHDFWLTIPLPLSLRFKDLPIIWKQYTNPLADTHDSRISNCLSKLYEFVNDWVQNTANPTKKLLIWPMCDAASCMKRFHAAVCTCIHILNLGLHSTFGSSHHCSPTIDLRNQFTLFSGIG